MKVEGVTGPTVPEISNFFRMISSFWSVSGAPVNRRELESLIYLRLLMEFATDWSKVPERWRSPVSPLSVEISWDEGTYRIL